MIYTLTLYNRIINNINYSLNDILNEEIGTIYLNNEIKELINKIIQDIENKNYIAINYKDYMDIYQFDKNDNLYILTYNDIKLPWLKSLLVIINYNKNISDTNGAALINKDNQTIFSKEKILLATIIINNPDRLRFPVNTIAHELNHYYSEFRKYLTTGNMSNYKDIDLFISNIHANIDLLNLNIGMKLIESFIYVRPIFLEILYYLNESEIKAHIENIFQEISNNINTDIECKNIKDITKFSETLRIYYNLYEIINYYCKFHILENYIKDKILPIFKEQYNYKKLNRLSVNTMYKKIFNKFKKVFKHIYCIYNFSKNEYIKKHGA